MGSEKRRLTPRANENPPASLDWCKSINGSLNGGVLSGLISYVSNHVVTGGRFISLPIDGDGRRSRFH